MNNVSIPSILIVDDIPTNIKVLFKILHNSGFKVSVAKSGENALEKVHEVLPDLILLDVIMPGIDGFETCRRLKAKPETKDIPIIFMAADADAVDKVKGLKIGAVDYITKPIEYEEVLARINIHLELRRTQIKLMQEEKMSSLGQLLAGIAHEINNPVNFIYGNLIHIQQHITDLLKLIDLYEMHTPVTMPEVKNFSKKIELEFLKQDLPNMITSMELGTERVQEIVRSLRIFSRLDETQCKRVNLHEGLDSTLIILSSRLKATQDHPTIKVVKEYGDLPVIECYPGKIYQVFMNLIANAIDAIEDSILAGKIIEQPTISIYTAVTSDKNFVIVQIADNGIGMSAETQKHIFEHFFTTKPVGKGTGLGLAIAYQIIVEKHGGTLEVNSALGEGSKFTLTIPIQQT